MSRQYIEGADFSLERFTGGVPQDGRYYLLQSARVVAVYETPDEAQQAYDGLCQSYWGRMLLSESVAVRLQAARGILRRDRSNRTAWETLANHGDRRERNYAAESLRRLDRQAA